MATVEYEITCGDRPSYVGWSTINRAARRAAGKCKKPPKPPGKR